MAFFDQDQISALRIKKMVFHLVGPKDEDFVRLEAIDPEGYSGFFIERICAVNLGTPYKFSDASATRERLNRIAGDPNAFQVESEKLAEDFQRAHAGSAAKGAMLFFLLELNTTAAFAILKYDDETVLSYDLTEGENGRKRASLNSIDRTFVQNRNALQKSALISLHDHGGDLMIRDRQNQQKIARYYENFLGAHRVHQDAQLTAKFVDVVRNIIRQNKDSVPEEVYKNATRKTYEAAAAGGQIDGDNQKNFLSTVIGRLLPDDDPLVRKFYNALRAERIEGIPINLDPSEVRRPSLIRYKTRNNIQIRVPGEVDDRVEVLEDRIIIHDLTLPPTFIHSEVRSGGLVCPGGRV